MKRLSAQNLAEEQPSRLVEMAVSLAPVDECAHRGGTIMGE